jgi:hypothetical protein
MVGIDECRTLEEVVVVVHWSSSAEEFLLSPVSHSDTKTRQEFITNSSKESVQQKT